MLTAQKTLAAREKPSAKSWIPDEKTRNLLCFWPSGEGSERTWGGSGRDCGGRRRKRQADARGEASCKVDGEWSTRMWLWRDRYGDIPHSSVTSQLSTCRLPWATGGRRRGKGWTPHASTYWVHFPPLPIPFQAELALIGAAWVSLGFGVSHKVISKHLVSD